MSPEVKERAEALAEALAESEEYQALKDATDQLEKHEAAKIMMRDFRRKQHELQRKVMEGQNPTEEEVNALQEAYRLVAFNPYVRKVIEAEAVFSAMLAEIQRILAEAVGLEIPDMEGDDQDDAADGKQDRSDRGLRVVDGGGHQGASSPRSRLWVPGR